MKAKTFRKVSMIGAVNSTTSFGANYQVRGKDYAKIRQGLEQVANDTGKVIKEKAKVKGSVAVFEPTSYISDAGQHYNIFVQDNDGRFWQALKKMFGTDAFWVSK